MTSPPAVTARRAELGARRGRPALLRIGAMTLWGALACAPSARWGEPHTAPALLEAPLVTFELLEVALEPAPPRSGPAPVVEHRPPELLEGLTLEHPSQVPAEERAALARLHRVQITLEVYVDERGSVRHVSIRDGNAPGDAYRRAAIAAVERSRFLPGTENGVPTSMWTLLSLEYPLP